MKYLGPIVKPEPVVIRAQIGKFARASPSIENLLMRLRSYIDGPYRGSVRSSLGPLAQEALYACGGLALVGYLCYAFIVG